MSQIFTFTIIEVILLFPFFLHLRNKHDGNLHHSQWYHQVKQNGNVINKTQDNKTPFLISIYTHLIIPKMRWYVLCNLPQWTASIIIKNNSINVFLCLYRNCTNCYSIIVSSLTNGKSAVAWLFNVGLKKKKSKTNVSAKVQAVLYFFWKIPSIANAEWTPWHFQMLSVWFWPNTQFSHRRSYFNVNNLRFGLLIVNNLKQWENEPPLVEFKAEFWILEKI